ncbi:MAG: pyruvate dehydrogenase complex dihydrolipoamide acetyltransferase [Alphaproteobacteria bacterium]|nr:pyruvate dehydrogenase complex dihydrolipoamide acetyltransferase [Alphaproteobacteria bacterium]
MPHNILMPALSPTMTEGKLSKWLKKEGDKVKAGQVIAEIETDKATMEVEAVDEGTLGKILVPAGTEGVKVNALIAVLLEEGESVSDIKITASTPHPNLLPQGEKEQVRASKLPLPSAGEGRGEGGKRLLASPLAKRLAKEKGIDLSRVQGSGPHGRVVKADLSNVIPSPQPSPGGRGGSGGIDAKVLADAYQMPYTAIPNSMVRKVIARRLLESKQTVPHYYLTIHCDIDKLMQVRKEVNEGAQGYKLSVNDFIIKAAAMAQVKVPAANVAWTEDAVLQYSRADISVAVATPNGLITPIIKDAASKSLKDISIEMKDLAARAKDGKLKPQEFQGGTMSVSNLGMFGVAEFTAIINPPQCCILAVGAGEQRAVVKNGQLGVATMMTATASFDHRAVDGAVGAEYLAAFKKLIEETPVALLL